MHDNLNHNRLSTYVCGENIYRKNAPGKKSPRKNPPWKIPPRKFAPHEKIPQEKIPPGKNPPRKKPPPGNKGNCRKNSIGKLHPDSNLSADSY